MTNSNNENHILFVDDDELILKSIARLFKKEKINILTAKSGEEGLEMMKENNFSVIVADMNMPSMNGTEFLYNVFKQSPDTIRILLTGQSDISTAISAINKGKIYCYIKKPWNDQHLVLTVTNAAKLYETQVSSKPNDALDNYITQVVYSYIKLIEFNFADAWLFRIMAKLAKELCLHLQYSMENTDIAYRATLLSAIGKISINKEILDKPYSCLTEHEKYIFQQHPNISYSVLSPISKLKPISTVIQQHRESLDGSGFPNKLKGNEINEIARAVNIAICYYELQQGKIFSHKLTKEEAITYIKEQKGKKFSELMITKFIELVNSDVMNNIFEEVTYSLDNSSPGMKLQEDVYHPNGTLLIPKNHILTETSIEKLRDYENTNNSKFKLKIYHNGSIKGN